jgi:hypothetical protein
VGNPRVDLSFTNRKEIFLFAPVDMPVLAASWSCDFKIVLKAINCSQAMCSVKKYKHILGTSDFMLSVSFRRHFSNYDNFCKLV